VLFVLHGTVENPLYRPRKLYRLNASKHLITDRQQKISSVSLAFQDQAILPDARFGSLLLPFQSASTAARQQYEI
jgi:hypothetical protein